MRARLVRACRQGLRPPGPPWRVLFFGTDRFAVTALRALRAAGYRPGTGERGLRGDGVRREVQRGNGDLREEPEGGRGGEGRGG